MLNFRRYAALINRVLFRNSTSELIDRAVVEAAYRVLLGREPESEDIVRLHQATSPTEMLVRFVGTNDFQLRHAVARIEKSLTLLPEKIEANADPSELRQMIARVGEAWTSLGREEPHWSVLTDPRFKAATIEDRKIEFYDTGAAPVEYFEAAARRAGERLADKSTCFELGCGVGRVTTHLASKFRHVIASDISDDHLRIAREHLSSAGLTNVSYFQLRDVGSIRSAPPFDALFTVIVLQHNPPPIIAFLLRELLAKLSPGGLGYFQVPTYLTNYTFEVDTYLRSQDMPQMELHALSQRDTFDIIAAAACRVLDIREDSWMGDMGGISNSFLVKKTCQ